MLYGVSAVALILAIKALSVGFLVWSFEEGVFNRWGGQFNAYGRLPSWTRTYLDPKVHQASSGHSLRLTVHRERDGFAGVWLGFYPASGAGRQFFDARTYRFLSFWVKGEKGGEDFEVQLADDTSEQREEEVPKRPIRAYLPKGVSTDWQEVLVPLSDFPGVHLGRLANLVLNFPSPGDYRVYLDDVTLKRLSWGFVWRPESRTSVDLGPAYEKTRRAMWVWNIRTLLGNAAETERLIELCSKMNIREIFLAVDVTYRIGERGPEFVFQNAGAYRQFIERAHRAGLRVHALAGNPEWAIRENHGDALEVVDHTLAFNRSVPKTARFDGIHFDVEPNALIQYSEPTSRSQLLMDFLELIAKAARAVRAEPDMEFGCDVTPWFYADLEADRPQVLVNFNLDEKTVGEHLTDLLDTVAIMDYHNQASGANGIIASALPALRYAASKGKKVLIGLDTYAEPDSTIYFVCSIPVGAFYYHLTRSGLRTRGYLGDFRLSAYPHKEHVHVGLVAPEKLEGRMRAAFEKALIDLARQLGGTWGDNREAAETVLGEARAAILSDPEWRGFERFELKDVETRGTILGFRSTYLTSMRNTFYGRGREVFLEETRSVVEWVGDRPGFGGLALHNYESFRKLMEGR